MKMDIDPRLYQTPAADSVAVSASTLAPPFKKIHAGFSNTPVCGWAGSGSATGAIYKGPSFDVSFVFRFVLGGGSSPRTIDLIRSLGARWLNPPCRYQIPC